MTPLPLGDRLPDWRRWAGATPDELALWIADMDFACAEPIQEALIQRIRGQALAYPAEPTCLRAAIVELLDRSYRWEIDPDWLVVTPGVVPGLYFTARQLLSAHPERTLLVPRPVYGHLRRASLGLSNPVLDLPLSELVQEGRRRRILTAQGLRQAAVDCSSRAQAPGLLMFCNPQNPGGAVYQRGELVALAEAVLEQDGLWVCSDEIHAGLVLDAGRPHLPIAALGDAIARRTITWMSAGKTFNIAGLGLGWAVVPDAGLRAALQRELTGPMAHPSLLSLVATQAALAHGEDWRQRVLGTLRQHRARLDSALRAAGTRWQWDWPEAGHLVWMHHPILGEAAAKRLSEAGLRLSPGEEFGEPAGCRLNIATSAERLERAIEILVEVDRTA